jgi:hypothetical protein
MGIDNFGLLDEEGLQSVLNSLIETKKLINRRSAMAKATPQKMTSIDYSPPTSSFCQAPLDAIADYFRSIRGVMLDMYRRPDELLAACEIILPILLSPGISRAKAGGNTRVFIPIHGGLWVLKFCLNTRNFTSIYQKYTHWPENCNLKIHVVQSYLAIVKDLDPNYKTIEQR